MFYGLPSCGEIVSFLAAAAAEAAGAAVHVYLVPDSEMYFHVGKHLVARETHGSQLGSSISTYVRRYRVGCRV